MVRNIITSTYELICSDKFIKNSTIVVIAIYFINMLLYSLSIGGRWDLNEQIALGLKIQEGALAYSSGSTDLYEISSPYWPGVGLISFFIHLLTNNVFVTNQIMIFIAVIIGLSFFLLAISLSQKLSANHNNKALSIGVLLYGLNFTLYKIYMFEFKPDTVLLLISFFMLLSYYKKGHINIFKIIILLVIATLFKQSSFILYMLGALLIIFSTNYKIFTKMVFIFILFIISILILSILFRVPNLKYYTVDIMKEHSFLPLKSIISSFKEGLINNWLFLLTIPAFIKWGKAKKLLMKANIPYSLFSIVWLSFSMLALFKVGGNVGNLEVGIIVLLPIGIIGINNFLNKYKYSNTIISLLLILFLSFTLYSLPQNIKKLNLKYQYDDNLVNYLRDNFKGAIALVDGDSYIVSKLSNLKIKSEFDTIVHFNNVEEPNFDNLNNAFVNKTYDIILLKNDIDISMIKDQRIMESFSKNYKKLDTQDINPIINLYVPNTN